MTKILSKSKYTLSCQCQKALWLRCNKPEEAVVDPALASRFEAGAQIGKMARSLFGDYTDTTAYTNDGQLDISAMIRTTQQLMQSGCNVICEAAFSTPNHYCAVDILRKTAHGWAIYEVKSSTSHMIVKDPEKTFGKYAADIAYQRWVLEQCGVNVTETYLVTVNSDYVYMGQLDIQQFFNITPMDAIASNEYLKVPNQVTRALQTMSENQEPKIDLSAKCNKPYKCAFWGYCTQHLPKHSVFNLYGVGCNFNQQLKLYKQGIISFEDLAQQSLGPIQTLQVNSWLRQQECINPAGIVKFLNKVRYPLYFLDFESMQPAVPIYPNSKPYMQICFQYSLHYIEQEGGELKHKAFLAKSNGQDPRRELAESLCRDIPRNACIMAYNDPFEKTRIKEMASIFPDLADHLMNIHSHIIDLLIPFREGNYYRPNMGGSFSIKVVLPSLFPNDPELDYHHLSELVQNGGDAMTIFPKMKDMHPDEEQKARQALLEYCKLDTYAMVKIWRKMIEIV